MEISPGKKSETMALLGQDTVRCKIVVQNKCLKQIKNFKYIRCEIPYQNEKQNIQQKLANFLKYCELLNRNFQPTLVQKF
jgi:hypothetical protein